MTGQIMISFQGEGSGVEELTWAQRSTWEAMRAANRSIVIGGVMPLSEGTTVDQIAGILRFAMCRHQSLRTRLRFAADGRPLQVLSPSGEVALRVVDVADDQDPAVAAEAIRARQELATFDYVNEWPVWMTLVRHQSVITHLVAMYCHLAVDGGAMAALAMDLSNMDDAEGSFTAAVRGIQPIELARQQRGLAAQRQSSAALRHWENQHGQRRRATCRLRRRHGTGHRDQPERRAYRGTQQVPARVRRLGQQSGPVRAGGDRGARRHV